MSEYVARTLAAGRLRSARPKTGAQLVSYWQGQELIGSRPDITDSQEHAHRLRDRAERQTLEFYGRKEHYQHVIVFEVVGKIEDIETIAVGSRIRDIRRLRRIYGAGRWRKPKVSLACVFLMAQSATLSFIGMKRMASVRRR